MKTTKITRELILSFNPCYDPMKIGFTEDLELTALEVIDRFKDKVINENDIIWLLLHNEFLTDKELRLFAVFCAREAIRLVDNKDHRSVNAINIAEKYANGEANYEELHEARVAAWAAAGKITDAAAWAAAGKITDAAAWAAETAAWAAAGKITDAAAWAAATTARVAAGLAAGAAAETAKVAASAAKQKAIAKQLSELRKYFEK